MGPSLWSKKFNLVKTRSFSHQMLAVYPQICFHMMERALLEQRKLQNKAPLECNHPKTSSTHFPTLKPKRIIRQRKFLWAHKQVSNNSSSHLYFLRSSNRKFPLGNRRWRSSGYSMSSLIVHKISLGANLMNQQIKIASNIISTPKVLLVLKSKMFNLLLRVGQIIQKLQIPNPKTRDSIKLSIKKFRGLAVSNLPERSQGPNRQPLIERVLTPTCMDPALLVVLPKSSNRMNLRGLSRSTSHHLVWEPSKATWRTAKEEAHRWATGKMKDQLT